MKNETVDEIKLEALGDACKRQLWLAALFGDKAVALRWVVAGTYRIGEALTLTHGIKAMAIERFDHDTAGPSTIIKILIADVIEAYRRDNDITVKPAQNAQPQEVNFDRMEQQIDNIYNSKPDDGEEQSNGY